MVVALYDSRPDHNRANTEASRCSMKTIAMLSLACTFGVFIGAWWASRDNLKYFYRLQPVEETMQSNQADDDKQLLNEAMTRIERIEKKLDALLQNGGGKNNPNFVAVLSDSNTMR